MQKEEMTAEKETVTAQEICCPEFEPEPWENKTLFWENKKFIKGSVRTLFNMPLNFGSVMKKLDKAVRKADVNIPDGLCLSDHTSKWNMDVYLAVDRDVQGANNITLSGKYFSRVYEGPYRDTGKWCADYETSAKEKGYQIKKWYMWYTTCPKCARKYGKNYVAIVSEVD